MPRQLENEIDSNHAAFFRDWTEAAAHNWATLRSNDLYRQSYRRLVVIQALKIGLVEAQCSPGSAAFFYEAHNDALVSHVAASTGAWRMALQSLRGCIENVLCSIYYNDHPIELELWESGEFVIGFSELIRYMERHPRLSSVDASLTGLEVIKGEYGTLSKAVHGSAANFRMTDPASTVLLWSDDPIKASMWSTREKKTIEGIALLMVSLYRDLLQGARLNNLRDVLGFALGAARRRQLKALQINIPDL